MSNDTKLLGIEGDLILDLFGKWLESSDSREVLVDGMSKEEVLHEFNMWLTSAWLEDRHDAFIYELIEANELA